MTPQELFGALVRFSGFALILYGVYTGFWGLTFVYMPHYVVDKNSDERKLERPSTYFYAAFVLVLIGGFTIAIASDITRMAYSSASELGSRAVPETD